jgi:hypothetical protein
VVDNHFETFSPNLKNGIRNILERQNFREKFSCHQKNQQILRVGYFIYKTL